MYVIAPDSLARNRNPPVDRPLLHILPVKQLRAFGHQLAAQRGRMVTLARGHRAYINRYGYERMPPATSRCLLGLLSTDFTVNGASVAARDFGHICAPALVRVGVDGKLQILCLSVRPLKHKKVNGS